MLKKTMLGLTIVAGFVAAVVAVSVGTAQNASAASEKVTICHATSSQTNPYVQIVVSENAIKGHFDNPGTPKAGHEDDLFFTGEEDCPGEPSDEPVATCDLLTATKGLDNQYTFETSVTALNGVTVLGYEYDFGDGTVETAGDTTTHTYVLPGTYQASVSVDFEIENGEFPEFVTEECTTEVTVAGGKGSVETPVTPATTTTQVDPPKAGVSAGAGAVMGSVAALAGSLGSIGYGVMRFRKTQA